MSNKIRETRSHDEKYSAAKTAFDLLKKQAIQTGKKVVNISAVANASCIDRGYLYGNIDTPDEALREKFRKLGYAIAAWKKDFSSKPDSESESDLPRVEKELANSIRQAALLLEKHQNMRELYDQVCEQRDQSQDDLKKAEALIMKLQAKVGVKQTQVATIDGVSQLHQKPVIISPDDYYMVNGRYQGKDSSYRRKVAWGEAQDRLSDELLKPLPTTLFITIGIPGAGKSRWAKKLLHNRRAVVFDSTNLTMADRHDLLRIAKSSAHKDLKVIAVCFPIAVDTAKKRNAGRTADRRILDNVIEDAVDKIELPTFHGPFGQEDFHEILIVKAQP
ncbi:hypothetical protein [Vibrio splendidus]|uniref:hypothetical protein n=1 Tax=Vibrio splendidus TaxID=29497 RepID=UPI00246929A6|nr:hypothetical protein [Vibrio splendidus]MDH5919289.1 ATP-binding protein [Vibrio splendidus]